VVKSHMDRLYCFYLKKENTLNFNGETAQD